MHEIIIAGSNVSSYWFIAAFFISIAVISIAVKAPTCLAVHRHVLPRLAVLCPGAGSHVLTARMPCMLLVCYCANHLSEEFLF